METFGLYLLKSASWLSGFALVYLLFLQNERFFILKRIYLISGILISILFPLITIRYQVEVPASQLLPADMGPLSGTFNGGALPGPGDASGHTVDLKGVLVLLYLAGVLAVAVRTVLHFRAIYKTIKSSEISKDGTARVVKGTGFHTSFSFFNYVFVNPSLSEEEVEQVMNHELVHVRQKHWFDLLLAEFMRTFQWVNPFAWIYSRFIRLNHEYLADEDALQRTSDPAVYKAALVNQMMRAPVFSLSNSFSYSLNKKRFEMMKKIITSPYRKLKVLLVLPVFALVFYAFAEPEYSYSEPTITASVSELTIYQAPAIQQKEVKGIVLDENGKPIRGANINSTGTSETVRATTTGADGRFILTDVMTDAYVMVFSQGYKPKSVKAVSTGEMTIRLEKDPDYKPPVNAPSIQPRPQPVVALDGVLVEKTAAEIRSQLGYNFGTGTYLTGKAATDKYGEKGANGVYEVLTREKALSMGLKPPMPRLAPDDYPTFQGKHYSNFREWVINNSRYPEAAKTDKVEGWATVNYTILPDGTIGEVKAGGIPNTKLSVLNDELIRVVKTSPKWEVPKNANIKDPFTMGISVEFRLPDVISHDIEPFVVVEQMPMYPGGDGELLKFLADNTKYPEDLKAKNIGGRVIIRFSVQPDGNVKNVSVLRGVDPVLDAEAMRVVNLLKGFKPGTQGGTPVPVWYMVPITFGAVPTNLP